MTTNRRNRRIGIVIGWHVLLVGAVLFTLNERGYFDRRRAEADVPAVSLQSESAGEPAVEKEVLRHSIMNLETSPTRDSEEPTSDEAVK